ncbi:TPA: DinI family protein [Escherichia coli]|nr:DinI family protein [Escherichia coli]
MIVDQCVNAGQFNSSVFPRFPYIDVRTKPMMILPAINTNTNKHEKEQISRTVKEMFEKTDM